MGGGLPASLVAAIIIAAQAPARASNAPSPIPLPYTPRAALVHHVVSTKSVAAQEKFDEGLTLVYAFNRDEAARRFEAAAQTDPGLAMAWWGVALANGPNLNVSMSKERVAAAQAALTKAKALEAGCSPEERRYIDALAVRYPTAYASEAASRPGYVAYREAMGKLHADYPTDNDAATLYVESSMDVDEWGWKGGQPEGDAASLAGILENVLAADQNHVGANHYYVHLMDFVGVAQRALPSARRLSSLPVEPAASHLQHMSGHNYLDLGMFADVLHDNKLAVDDDRIYAASRQLEPSQLDYFQHNLDFYLGGALMLDDRPEADRAVSIADDESDPMRGLLAYARERRWDEVLAASGSVSHDGFFGFVWHYTRGVAFAGNGDARNARAELGALDATLAATKNEYLHSFVRQLDRMLGARIAHLDGDDARAASLLRSVIADVAPYSPETFPPWYFPAGEWLGDVLLDAGDNAGAEGVFRADLARTPHNPRALYGLMQALSREGRSTDARALVAEIAANWRGGGEGLRLEF